MITVMLTLFATLFSIILLYRIFKYSFLFGSDMFEIIGTAIGFIISTAIESAVACFCIGLFITLVKIFIREF